MGIRETSYFGWKTNYISASIPGISSIGIGFVEDLYFYSGSIYIASGKIYSGSTIGTINEWNVYKSNDDTFNMLFALDTYINQKTILGGDFARATGIAIDLSGNIFVCGFEQSSPTGANLARWVVRKSNITSDTSWATIDHSTGSNSGISSHARGIAVDSSGSVFVCGNHPRSGDKDTFTVRKSTLGTSGSFSTVLESNGTANVNGDVAYSIAIDSQDRIYVAGTMVYTTTNNDWVVFSSSDHGSTWFSQSKISDTHAYSVATNKLDEIFVAGNTTGYYSRDFGDSWSTLPGGSSTTYSCAIDSFNNVYSLREGTTPTHQTIIVHPTGSTNFGASTEIDKISVSATSLNHSSVYGLIKLKINKKNNKIYNFGNAFKDGGYIREGQRSSNSASLGPLMLAASIGYYFSSSNGLDIDRFKLNNVSEFPHSSGLFQMKNMVLGTKSQGTAGKTDDSIVQKRFVGSFVRVLWPKQENIDIKGDTAKKPGKLTTDWAFGDVINLEGKNFDHLALNCYALKEVSGTLDSILVRIETRGLNDSGFVVDQTIEQTISSSYETEALYRDALHRKDLNYGDTAIKELAWKIPVDLTNVKEIRIAAKHKNGQSDDKNKQFLTLGRFITKDKNHGET